MPYAGKAQHQGTSREGFSCGQGYSLRFLRGKRAGAFYGSKAKGQRLASAKLLFRTAAGALFHATRMAFARRKCGSAAFLLFKAAASKLLLHKRGVLQMQQRSSAFSPAVFCRAGSVFRPFGGWFFSKASAPHGACRQTRKAFFRGRSRCFLRRGKKLGDFHSNLCLCTQKSLNFFEICLNFFQITIEKYLSVC